MNLYFAKACCCTNNQIIVDLVSGEVYNYAITDDRVAIHLKYGGSVRRISQSGLSGEGRLPNHPNLVAFPTYWRTPVWDMKKNIGEYAVYFPYEYGLPGCNLPIVAVRCDEKQIAFFPTWATMWNFIKSEDSSDGHSKSITIEGYCPTNGDTSIEVEFVNPYHCGGVPITWFISPRYEISKSEYSKSFFEGALNIREHDGKWYHKHRHNYYDKRWEENPRRIVGPIVDGWVGTARSLYYRRHGGNIQAFVEVVRPPKLQAAGISWYCEYEQEWEYLTFFSVGIEAVEEEMHQHLLEKMRADYDARQAYLLSIEECKSLLAKIPSISVKDSTDTGNCLAGTMRFVEEYDLVSLVENGEVTSEKLLTHPRIDEMLRVEAFRKVIYMVANSSANSVE